MQYDYDLYVIGAGSGGVRAARTAAGLGARVGLCEDRFMGGTCVNVGCVPKKLFVYASHFAHDFRDARGFGWQADTPTFDWSTLVTQKNKEIARLNGVYDKLLKEAGVDVHRGRGQLRGPHEVSVKDAVQGQQAAGSENTRAKTHTNTWTAKHILIATGGTPVRPDIPGAELGLVSDDLFSLKTLPKRIIIVGSGYIGVEFACIFAGLGCDVSLVFRRSHMLRGFDKDIRTFLGEEMRKKGIVLYPESTLRQLKQQQIKNQAQNIVLELEDRTLSADAVVFATGRKPNTERLGLEDVGVARSASGAVVVDEAFRSSAPSVYAIGDVVGYADLTPVALAQGTALANMLFDDQPITLAYDNIPSAVFSQPPVGTVGLTEEAARQRFKDIDVYRSSFRPLKMTLAGREERTLMKLVVDRATDRVVGCHIVGEHAGDILQGFAVAIQCGATKQQFNATLGIHPTAAEELVTMHQPVA